MKIQDIIIWILFILAIIFVAWYIFGKSPTFEQTLFVLLLSLSVTTLIKDSVLENSYKNLKKSFTHLAKDFKHHITHN